MCHSTSIGNSDMPGILFTSKGRKSRTQIRLFKLDRWTSGEFLDGFQGALVIFLMESLQSTIAAHRQNDMNSTLPYDIIAFYRKYNKG